MNNNKARVIAFYLPQFHPIPENDKWWGKGFTEWTNVGNAKKLFPGHYQPRVPQDLGYYDLRLSEVRQQQAELAREAGVDGFCYWHYWLGNGQQLLERPLQEVIACGEPDFPFCLGWANHSWEKRMWNAKISILDKTLLIEQTYPGLDDIDNHFYTMLSAFKDQRYMKIDGRLIFLIYNPLDIPDFNQFKDRWQELAQKNGLPGFYFIGQARSDIQVVHPEFKKYDAINYDCISHFFNHSRWRTLIAFLTKLPITKPYKRILKDYHVECIQNENIIPTVYPGWDVTPRRGVVGTLFTRHTPELFYKHVKHILSHTFFKEDGKKVIFLKSWNEWAEGNYMEPDMRFGKGFINALNQAISEESL